ncbi:TraR/DksA family transcriptional regulator [Aeromicrobium sp. 636]|uniref:TraR/DksA C4-type zinc finger protein n=1 Tax=Aeromicrobium senzhongii TaxID=2663859 RepID=A0A8I0K2D4_9ACTN|nr:TraR/DksA C4-type zinc finger protein [Aeromicrobium senzhongii]MCQ3997779.1 TraR/DksA family transcriptional regulator [Aeromicrobium sp. 636]
MTVEDRERLETERLRTVHQLASLTRDFDAVIEASKDSNADDEHDPDGATVAFERSQVDSLLQQARRHLDEIDDAQSRLDEGSYGVCESCGRPIAAARLEARPVARTCFECASARR